MVVFRLVCILPYVVSLDPSLNPLDVVTKTADGRYFNDLSDEERTAYDRQGEQQFTNFVVSNLLK